MVRSVDTPDVGVLPPEFYMMVLLIVVPFLLLLYYACNLYTPKRVQGRRLEGGNILKANLICGLTLMAALFWFKQGDVSRIVLGVFMALNVTLTVIERNIVRMVLMNARRIGLNQKYVLLVGYSRAAEEYIDRIVQNPQWGYKILGILDDNVASGTLYKNVEVLGFTESLSYILEGNHPDEIAITLGLNEYDKLEHIVAMCEKSGVHTKFIPDYSKIIPTKPYTEDLLGLPVVNIRHVPLTNTFNMMIKRVFDLVGASVCIVLFSPVMLITAILIKLTSKGPLIFTQERVGLHNRPFKVTIACVYAVCTFD